MYYYENDKAWHVEAITKESQIIVFQSASFIENGTITSKKATFKVINTFDFEGFLKDTLKVNIIDDKFINGLVAYYGGFYNGVG